MTAICSAEVVGLNGDKHWDQPKSRTPLPVFSCWCILVDDCLFVCVSLHLSSSDLPPISDNSDISEEKALPTPP